MAPSGNTPEDGSSPSERARRASPKLAVGVAATRHAALTRLPLLQALVLSIVSSSALGCAGPHREAVGRTTEANGGSTVWPRTKSAKVCYSMALAENRSLSGHMLIRLVISGTGEVQERTLVENDLGPKMGECVLAAVSAWPPLFQPPEGPVVVDIPMYFSTKDSMRDDAPQPREGRSPDAERE